MTPSSGKPDASAAGDDGRVHSLADAHLAHLLDQWPVSLASNLALAVIVAFALHATAPVAALATWLVLLIGIVLARGLALHRARRTNRADGIESTLRRITLFTLATAAAWGASPWLLLGDASAYESLVLLITLAGLSAGAIPVVGCIWAVYLGYIALAITPVAAWLFLQAETIGPAPGAMTLVFLVALAAAGRNYATTFERAHHLAARNARARARVASANHDLRARMEEALTAREALRRSEQRFHAAFDQAPIGMALVHPDGRIFQANPALRELLDQPADRDAAIQLRDLVLPEDAPGFGAMLDTIAAGHQAQSRTDVRLVRPDGQVLWTAMAIARVDEGPDEDPYLIVEVQDTTESVELSARLRYEASHDELTGLTNRREFERRLQHLLGNRRRSDHMHTLCYLDLDRFKVINDGQGHFAGDEVLRQVAGLLQDHTRAGDTVARVGGDEFALLLENCDVPQALRITEGLIRAIGEFRFLWNDEVFRLDLSVGIAEVLPHEGAVSEIVRNADNACRAAKEAGGARAHVYRVDDDDMQRRHGEIAWVSRITRALEHDEFELYAQPIVSTRARAAGPGMYFEILVRMRAEDGGLLLPQRFLPAAERYGLATQLDRWVVRAVFDWFTRHPEQARRVAACAINLSGTSLDDHEFAQQLVTDLHGAPLEPAQLRFEVTETAAIGHLSQAGRFMKRLEGMGCRFALDDFGSGLSSFGYLRSLPVDTLKIDGQFVRDIARDPVDHALVRSINDIGRVLGLATVAEYVEDEETLELLRTMGVDFVQGFHTGRPVPLETLFEQGTPVLDSA